MKPNYRTQPQPATARPEAAPEPLPESERITVTFERVPMAGYSVSYHHTVAGKVTEYRPKKLEGSPHAHKRVAVAELENAHNALEQWLLGRWDPAKDRTLRKVGP